MKILNVDFSEIVTWSEETLLPILQKANPTRTEKELTTLIKASKLVKDELQPTTSKSAKREKQSTPNDRESDNIQ
jgi:hypothetical protein